MSAVQRAFVVGAVVASRDSCASTNALSKLMQRGQSGLSKVVRHIEKKAEEGTYDIWDPILYENNLGRGRSSILTQEQKDAIIALTISNREHRQQEVWQAIKHGNFNHIVPEISTTTFENVMYEAEYSRRRPGWKPPLTKAQKKERYEWALDHNPDLYKEYDNLGFNFRKVYFTDETPARVGDQRGMSRTWAKEDEVYDNDVKKDRKPPGSAL